MSPSIPARLATCVVSPNATLREALSALDRGALAIALICDGTRLLGVLTDGDIRRAILRNVPLDASIETISKPTFVSVSPSASRVEVLDMMQARGIEHVPVVGDDQTLVGLHLLRETLRATELPNWAVIMAGGQGVRLRPITEFIPKPMIRVAGRPILERIVLHLVGFGIRHIFLSVNYMSHIIEEYFGDGSNFGCSIRYIREETPLGTCGSLRHLPSRPTSPLILMNGDLVTQASISGMLRAHSDSGAVATLGIRRYVHTVPFGCVTLDGDRVVTMEEKPHLTQLVNTGIYVLEPALLRRIPESGPLDTPQLLDLALAAGDAVHGYEIEEEWIDVGQRDQLARARGVS